MKRAAAAVVVTLVVLAILEIGARYYSASVIHRSTYPLYRFNSYRIYEHVPGYREGENGRDWIVINNQGFRRVGDTATAKPPHTFRVFLMGGSAAYGMSSQAPYPISHLYPEETIDAQLEKMLKERHPDQNIEVINAAVVGYEVFQHTAYLQSQLLDFEPDMVIFNDGVNDHYIDNPAYDYYGDCSSQFWTPRLQNASLGGWFDYGAEWLGHGSALARLYSSKRRISDMLEHYDGARHPQMVIGYENDAERISAHRVCAQRGFLRSVEMNLMLLKAHHVEVLVTRQAQLALRDESLLTAQEKAFLEMEGFRRNAEVLAPVVAEELTTLTNRYGVPFVDLIPVFNQKAKSNQQLFIDWCHLTAPACQITAEAMLPAVEKVLAARP